MTVEAFVDVDVAAAVGANVDGAEVGLKVVAFVGWAVTFKMIVAAVQRDNTDRRQKIIVRIQVSDRR